MKIRKSYSFAIRTSVQITIYSFLLSGLVVYLFKLEIPLLFIIFSTLLLFLTSFILIQYYVEKFIYQRIKKIYQDVSLFDIKDFKNTLVTSDIESLSNEVSKFALEKTLEIESLNKQAVFRREFMGNVAHELKTPLFSIQGYLLTLLDGAISDKKVRNKYLKQAAKNTDRLINIVEDLDFISKLDSKRILLNIQEFDIVHLTKNVFEMMELIAEKNNVTLVFDKPYTSIKVFADEQRIEQVLENLITNSIKYGKKNGVCRLSFKYDKQNKLTVCLQDEGEGIAPEHLSRIFERFYRVDTSRSREEGGSGLGLSIVKHIIEAHNETISVTSEKGKGSEFCFTLNTEAI